MVRRRSFFAKDRTWLNILLFILTILSTLYIGLEQSASFLYSEGLPEVTSLGELQDILLSGRVLALALAYMVSLIAILLAHEMGHYLTCRYYRIDATLPFFIPAPTLIGTMGAFIKIRSPITRKHRLFDIGVAGPIAGFLLSLPVLVYGLSQSKAVPALAQNKTVIEEGIIVFGEPLLFQVISAVVNSGISSGYDLLIHPMAFAGWVGILVTALNLFPIGQLDGGHVVYALFGPRVRKIAPLILVAFIVMGIFFWAGWFIWAFLIGILGLRHPSVWDEQVPLSQGRKVLALVVIVIFILSFIPDPIKGFSLLDILQKFAVL